MKLASPTDIAILMGTYNGSKYLAEQLDSIINQTNHNWTLYIRDDRSVDNTLEIIAKYCANYSNIILIQDNKGKLQARDNFFELLKKVESNYYMFCDQDDIWLPDKIEITFNRMRQKELINPGKPLIVYTDLKVVDANLKVIEQSFMKYSGINVNLLPTYNYLSVRNVMPGCTIMFNKPAYHVSLPFSQKAVMHDCWIALKVAAQNGVIEYINESTILYRQHDNNVIGAKIVGRGYFNSKIKSIHTVIKQNITHLKMLRCIKKTSLVIYLWHKGRYILKR